jgi:hypothetical protein
MTDTPAPITTREGLAEHLAGMSDDAVEAFAAAKGVDQILEQVFTAWATEHFVPERAGDHRGVAQWNVAARDGVHVWQLRIQDGTCRATRGTPDHPRITLALTVPDFMRFLAGSLDGMEAFMTGRLRIDGDELYAPVLQGFFSRA